MAVNEIRDMKNWVIEFNNEWKQLTGKYNWYTFTLIYIYGEKSWDGYELWVTVLGLGVYIRYNTAKSHEQFAEWDKEKVDLIETYSETWTALKDR